MLRFLLSLIICSSGPLVLAQDVVAGMSLDRLQRYEDFVRREIDSGKISGAVSLVHRKGEQVYANVQGYSDLDEKAPMVEDQIFYIQSMTKPIISVAFMMLYEEGHFFLTDPVSKYIPSFKDWEVIANPESGPDGETEPLTREITIKDLLTHTAGMSHGLGGNPLERAVYRNQYGQEHFSVQSRLDSLMTIPLIGQPGEQWHYSCAPDVLSVLIEQFSGMPTNEFLIERIFDPLGMIDTRYNLDEGQQKRVASLHYYDETGKLLSAGRGAGGAKMVDNTVWSGVNGLWSTARDYMIFARMMLNQGSLDDVRILSRKTVELMAQNHVGDLFGPGLGFGLGLMVVTDIADHGLLSSPGVLRWSGAFNTHFFIDPEEELVALFMTQMANYTDYYQHKLRLLVTQAIVD
ncbi:MAG: serine hydrolase [Bacteroidota bacterium]